MKTILCLLLLFLPVISFAQKEQSIWYFGQNAGLDLTQDAPANLTGGKMTAKGGGATMADASGNLLFYTDGVRVWNKQHQVMVNGTGLKGNPDVTQTVVIVPQPLHRSRYYIFTTDTRQGNTPNALRYSEVDISLQGGLGEVVQKNIFLLADVTEKVTATFHANNQDFWLLTHTWNTNTFYAYKVDRAGVSPSAVTTDIGSVYAGSLTTHQGSFKLNNAETMGAQNQAVVCLPDLRIFERLFFESNQGKFKKSLNLTSLSEKAAYAEFTTSLRLYSVSTKADEIFEYDISKESITNIYTSCRSIMKGTGLGDLRLARDGLIYVASSSMSLHTIDYKIDPTLYDKPAVVKRNAVSLGSNTSLLGLPNTIASYTQPRLTWGYWEGCPGEPITFMVSFPNSIDSLHWNFDDPLSGAANFSKALRPTHSFKTRGKQFKVHVTVYSRGTVQEETIFYNGSEIADLGADTTVCFTPGQTFILQPKTTGSKPYKWQDGSTNLTYAVTKPGTYWIEVAEPDRNCIYRDSIVVKSFPLPTVTLGKDTTLCTGKTLLLQAGSGEATYRWQDGSTDATYLVSTPGWYKVQATNSMGCSTTDSIRVYYLTPPTIDLGRDTIICAGTEFILDVPLPGVTYRWQDGSSGSRFKVTQPGTYWVDASIDVCTARDSIVVKTRSGCLGNVFVPNIITPNGDGLNDAFALLDPDKSSVWHLEVFNRQGNLVFRNPHYDNRWEAMGLSDGVYYYLLKDNRGKSLKGYVEVIR